MIIDMHYHLDERMEPIQRLVDQMDQHGIDKIVLIAAMVDPFHVEGTAENISNLMRKMLTGSLNRVGLLIYESLVTGDGKFKVLNKSYKIDPYPDNGLVAKAIADYPGRFYGWFFINPLGGDTFEDIESNNSADQWLGIKCHPFWHRYPISKLNAAAAYCVEKCKPMLVHLGGGKENGDYCYLPEKYPDLKLIYAHAGLPHYRKIWPYIKEKKNVYVDLSSPYLDEPLRREAVQALGADKCLYGSDGPFGYPAEDNMYDHGAILDEINRMPLSAAEKEKILGGNFAEIMAG
ncbi:MAG: amidohydrolase family protein [Bacillota bacterium]